MITKYATVELQVHTVSELNRMNLKLHGKESLSVMCHFYTSKQKRIGHILLKPQAHLLREQIRLINNDSPHQPDTEVDLLLHCVSQNAT